MSAKCRLTLPEFKFGQQALHDWLPTPSTSVITHHSLQRTIHCKRGCLQVAPTPVMAPVSYVSACKKPSYRIALQVWLRLWAHGRARAAAAARAPGAAGALALAAWRHRDWVEQVRERRAILTILHLRQRTVQALSSSCVKIKYLT